MSAPGRLARLPLRTRLVAGFSLAMLVLLVAAGTFVFWRVQFALDRSLNRDVDRASAAIRPLVRDGRVRDQSAVESAGVTYQVLTSDGHPRSGNTSRTLVTADQVREAAGGSSRLDVGSMLPPSDRPLRVLLTSVDGSSGDVLLVGVRRDKRDEALRELLLQLAVTGVATLLVTSFVGDRLARAALAPVERYRRQAADIAAGATGVRLEVPGERDDEVTRLGTTLNQMLAALEKVVAEERRFVDDASHELRTPITLLRSRVQLARRRERTVAEHEAVLVDLESDIDGLAALAEQLLELGASAALPDDAPVDVGPLLQRHLELRRYVDPGLTFSLGTPPEPIRVRGGHDLVRVVDNLLDNAARHGRPPVDLALTADDAWVRLVVGDAGDGMDPQMLQLAPERFARSDEARSRPGSGLGLSLVRTIVVGGGGELRLCARGEHRSFGRSVPWLCAHADTMTVTVLLPRL